MTSRFVGLRGNLESGTYSLDACKQGVARFHPDDLLRLRLDPGGYATPSFFANVVGDLTAGRSDHQFVRERST